MGGRYYYTADTAGCCRFFFFSCCMPSIVLLQDLWVIKSAGASGFVLDYRASSRHTFLLTHAHAPRACCQVSLGAWYVAVDSTR